MTYPIATHIPPPADVEHRKPERANKNAIYPFTEMLIGHSFFVPSRDPKHKTVRFAASVAGLRWGKKFPTRAYRTGTRVWRTE